MDLFAPSSNFPSLINAEITRDLGADDGSSWVFDLESIRQLFWYRISVWTRDLLGFVLAVGGVIFHCDVGVSC